MVGVLHAHILPQANEVESKIFWHKMYEIPFLPHTLPNHYFSTNREGDYHRYSAEIASGEKRKAVAEKAEAAYKAASELAGSLAPSHPVRLGLALNYSVFQYEILENKEAACNHAKVHFHLVTN